MTRGAAGVSQRTVSDCGDDEGRATPESHDGNASRAGRASLDRAISAEGSSRSVRARRALLAACAAFMAVAGLGLPGSGCLNPRPEELPSDYVTEPNSAEPVAAPTRETCDDNPLLGGCELPEQDINADPVDDDDAPPPSETASMAGSESSPEPAAPGEEAPVGGAGAGGDAGAETAADAGAP